MIITKLDYKKVQSVEMDLLNNELYLHEIESPQHNNVILWR
jgi:hypothetical protein